MGPKTRGHVLTVHRSGLLMSVLLVNAVPFGQNILSAMAVGVLVCMLVVEDIFEVMVRVLRAVLEVGTMAREAI